MSKLNFDSAYIISYIYLKALNVYAFTLRYHTVE